MSLSYRANMDLPEPPEEALAHSRRLQARVREEIAAAGGRIGFDRYMELVLYAPALGYYSAGARKIGADGDFVTAPEISPLFSRCVARQAAPVLRALGGGTILELGAGSGRMAADILVELEALALLPGRYLVLEPSGELRERQQATLDERCPQLADRLEWLDSLPPEPIEGVILGNEVVDALPVKRFRHDRGWQELCVSTGPEGFTWRAEAAGEPLVRALETSVPALPDGYESEIDLNLPAWMTGVAGALARGMVLLTDYGLPRRAYYHPQRTRGTLMCHYRHRAHEDPFLYPGLQDITAWVDFSALADAGIAAGLELAGYTTQAHLLLAGGLEAMAAEVEPADTRAQAELSRQIKLLTLPSEMGERFKAMAFTRGDVPLPDGFDLRDLSHTL
ncbi:MAG TPA: SAM-dependent methyltransferase [Gammaproteobacteria bacterium]|nr:SAM-dependent methyltransferase [Gammaproteobacteria bacterium]